MSVELFERLERKRAEYERAVTLEFPGAFAREDAEDLVSAALDRTLETEARPHPAAEDAWFRRVLFNVAADELRRQHGRAQRTKATGGLRRFVLLSELAEAGQELGAEDPLEDPQLVVEDQEERRRRQGFADVARQVLARLDEEDVRLLLIRHVELPDAGRRRCAEAAGISEEAWRHRYPRAWRRFVDAMAAAEPTPRCGEIRELIGQLGAGTLTNGAAHAARGRVDAHIVDCAACQVFARESYKILSISPTTPCGAAALDRIAEHAGSTVNRGGVEAAAGAAAGGVGLFAWLSGGGAGALLKVAVIVCGVSATAAGLCGGVVATYDYLSKPRHEQRVAHRAAAATPTVTPVVAMAIATRTVSPRITPKPTPAPTRTPAAGSTASPDDDPPAAVPSSATGQEFEPQPVAQQSQPAPVPAGVSSEFSP